MRHDIHFPCIMTPVCELLPNGPCLIPLDHNCINTLCSNPQRFNNGGTLDYPYILTDFSGNVYTSFSCWEQMFNSNISATENSRSRYNKISQLMICWHLVGPWFYINKILGWTRSRLYRVSLYDTRSSSERLDLADENVESDHFPM